jgi:hypothetical protein
MSRFLLILALVFCGFRLAPAQLKKTISDEKAREAIALFLARTQAPQGGDVTAIDDDSVEQVFPLDRFYVLQFRRYPVAPALPESLTYNNLLALHEDSTVELISDSNALKVFFASELIPITNEPRARNVVKAWLRLTQEFHQDGFFEFSMRNDSLRVLSEGGSIRAFGKAYVALDHGNSGAISVSLNFNRLGKLTEVKEVANVIAGRRPN